ncbi:hypothetical protein LSTR_LSTR003388 [Laodelphax striatellus]|uniref:MYND-type domain-containing protein n=1 Tax=Laodelphax striatellus TaxID=195883 RepID=A0A482X5T0_LAOST|nr:hypothetical protein LSTR_LSTR003388 [Laodelphax striatellus]
MEDQSSDPVVMPDITEPLTNPTESNENLPADDHQTISVTAVEVEVPVSSVPVTLPDGSLINVGSGATFNVITQEQLHYKPILCVDNSCICEARSDKEGEGALRSWVRTENGTLKATHIVIQDGPDDSQSNNPTGVSWTEAVNMPILPVRCKNTSADLHKNKFGSGGRGRCIKYGNVWLTPSEFESRCGRGSSKDWKRSIRFGGRSLQTLIDEGILTPHATSCTCAACCDDESAAGPVRLFTPYKRRTKRKYTNDNNGTCKLKRIECRESTEQSNDDESCDSSQGNEISSPVGTQAVIPPPAPTITPDLNPPSPDDFNPGDYTSINDFFKKLDEMTKKVVKTATTVKRMVEEVKEQWRAEKELLQLEAKREKEAAILAAQVNSSRTVFDTQVVEPITTVSLQPSTDDSDNKKCANCNRDAFAECSLCRRTPYCSTFCQRKDWSSHQVECVNSADQGQSIMLIVESAPENVLNHQE